MLIENKFVYLQSETIRDMKNLNEIKTAIKNGVYYYDSVECGENGFNETLVNTETIKTVVNLIINKNK